MTSLDMYAAEVRARAIKVTFPSLSTILVTLLGLVPFLLGWTVNAGWQCLTLLYAAFVKGWETGEARMGTAPRKPGGS